MLPNDDKGFGKTPRQGLKTSTPKHSKGRMAQGFRGLESGVHPLSRDANRLISAAQRCHMKRIDINLTECTSSQASVRSHTPDTLSEARAACLERDPRICP